jgi:transcriptional regulator with XRE-family HTH domain
MNALQQLIRNRMTELHCSYGEIARRGGLPRSTVHHLASNNRPVRVPNPQTLERLAVGLQVPEHVVRGAAAAAAGFVLDEQPADDPEIEVLVASLARLTAEERRHVSALVRSMLEAGDRERLAEPGAPSCHGSWSRSGNGGPIVLGWMPGPHSALPFPQEGERDAGNPLARPAGRRPREGTGRMRRRHPRRPPLR